MIKKTINSMTSMLLFLFYITLLAGFYIFLYIDSIKVEFVIISYMPLITVLLYAAVWGGFALSIFDKKMRKNLFIIVLTLIALLLMYLYLKDTYSFFGFEKWLFVTILLMGIGIVFHFRTLKVFNSIDDNKIMDYKDYILNNRIDFCENRTTKILARLIFLFRVLCITAISLNKYLAYIIFFMILFILEIVFSIWIYKVWKSNKKIIGRYNKLQILQYLLYIICFVVFLLKKTTILSLIVIINCFSYPFFKEVLQEYYYKE